MNAFHPTIAAVIDPPATAIPVVASAKGTKHPDFCS